jgi:hypothetical protein
MVMPLAGRVVAAVAGALLVLTAWASVTGTLIVSRSVGSWLTRWVDRIVNGAYRLATKKMVEYRRRDRLMATQAAAILLSREPASRPGARSCWPARTTRWDRACRPSIRCPTCTPSGNAGPRALPKATPLREADFPVEREAADAWPDFVGWRVNYEAAAYAVAAAVDAVPALWSGPRGTPTAAIPPIRPGLGRPPT